MFNVGQRRLVKWIDLDNVDSPRDDLRIRGKNKGCGGINESWWRIITTRI